MPEKISYVAESKLILIVMQTVATFDVATRCAAAVFLSTRHCPIHVKLSKYNKFLPHRKLTSSPLLEQRMCLFRATVAPYFDSQRRTNTTQQQQQQVKTAGSLCTHLTSREDKAALKVLQRQ
jgi:hypothetical protein